MVLIANEILLISIWVFWLPASIAHFIAYLIANRDDISAPFQRIFLGDIISFSVVAIITWLFIGVFNIPRPYLWLYYILHIVIISTLLSDIFSNQDSFYSGWQNIIKETLKESILIPWAFGIGIGLICSLIAYLV